MRAHPSPRRGLLAGLLMLTASISAASAIASGGARTPVTPDRAAQAVARTTIGDDHHR